MVDLPEMVKGFKVWFSSAPDRDDIFADLMYDHESWGEMDTDSDSGKLLVRLFFSPENDTEGYLRVFDADGFIETLLDASRGLHKRGIGDPEPVE